MTKQEWYDLLVKEFKVSRSTAKTMFSRMLQVKESREGNAPYTMAAALEKASGGQK